MRTLLAPPRNRACLQALSHEPKKILCDQILVVVGYVGAETYVVLQQLRVGVYILVGG